MTMRFSHMWICHWVSKVQLITKYANFVIFNMISLYEGLLEVLTLHFTGYV